MGPLPELSPFVERCQALTRELHAAQTPGEQAAFLAAALSRFWGAPLSACLVGLPADPVVCVADQVGTPRPDWQLAVAPALTDWAAQAGPVEPAQQIAEANLPGPALQEMQDGILHVARLECQGQTWGALAVAVPRPSVPAERTRPTELQGLAWFLSPWLRPASQGATVPAGSPEEAQARARLVVSDLAEAVAHEFNNLFNNILLQLEVLKRQGLSAELAAKAVGMQDRCRQAANLLKRLQRCGEALQPAFSLIDLNQIVREVAGGKVLGASRQWSRPVRLELDAALPSFPSVSLDLTRLVALLLEHATAVTPAGAAVTVRTARVPDGYQLVVEDGGPVVAAEGQRKLLEPFAVTRPGADDWTPSVCKILARRVQGSLRVANRGEEGMTFAVELPSEPEGSPALSLARRTKPLV